MIKNIKIAKCLIKLAKELIQEKELTLYMIVGISGSGKSTFAKSLSNNQNIKYFQADQYFEKDGEYLFDRTQLGNAHKWCQTSVESELKKGNSVIVSNTGLTLWQRQIYYKIAEKFGAKIKMRIMTGNFKNTHNVPEEVIENMKKKFQENKVTQSQISKYNIELI